MKPYTLEELKNAIMSITAVASINILAAVYDGEWLYFAIGIDAAICGFKLSEYSAARKK